MSRVRHDQALNNAAAIFERSNFKKTRFSPYIRTNKLAEMNTFEVLRHLIDDREMDAF